MKLLLGTQNRGKIRELEELIGDGDVRITTPFEEGVDLPVEETGATFHENASIKAKTYAARSGLVTLADDSGLVVDALDGAPGVYSARYAGLQVSDRDHYELLLENLAGVPDDRRSARFVSVVAIATPAGNIELCEGTCEGIVGTRPEGEGGFGYDPVFYIPELEKTMAQLTLEEKNRISHRSRAFRKAAPVVERVLREWDAR